MKPAATIRSLSEPGLKKGLLGCALLLQAVSPLLGAPQAMGVELGDQIQLILMAIERDRNFGDRMRRQGVERGVRMAIVYDPSERSLKNEMLSVFQGHASTPGGLSVTYFPLAYTSGGEWEQEARRLEINVLYITPGTEDHLQQLVKFCREYGVMSTTGVPDFVEQGVSLGMRIRLDRPRYIIHLGASKCEGTKFTSNFLRLPTTRKIKKKIDCSKDPNDPAAGQEGSLGGAKADRLVLRTGSGCHD